MVGLFCGSSTSLERQYAALFQAPNIHSKVMLYVAISKLHLDFVDGILSIEKSCQWFVVIAYDNFSPL